MQGAFFPQPRLRNVQEWNKWADTQGKWCHIHEQHGWIYGYWVCGRPHGKRTRLYGEYPHRFLERALRMFDVNEERILHAPSGLVPGPGVTMDRLVYGPGLPQIIGDVGAMPFPDDSFDLVLSDPPYSRADERLYDANSKPFPLKRFMSECHRVLQPGGFLGFLHTYTGPPRSNKKWRSRGIIAVAPSTQLNRTRTFSILQKIGRSGDSE